MDTLSRNRPPQFNWRNCGFNCGFGCEKASEDEGGGGGGESDEETAVDENEDDQDPTAGSQAEDSDAHLDSLVDETSSPRVAEGERFSSRIASSGYLSDLSGSLQIGPYATMDHSPEASARGNTRTVSPDPGMPYWTTGLPVVPDLPFAYYFLETPLRLSPQYEHCRGEKASHLVVPDRTDMAFLMEQTWRGYVPAYGYVSPPQVDGW
jgi:hypothetical protein